MFRSVSRAFTLCLLGFSVTGFPSAHATTSLYKRECNGCHSGPPTCNGCHAHGVHEVTGDSKAMNLVATTDKTEYIAGDDISVTFSGGNQPRPEDGWVGVTLYNEEGVSLGHVKTELPATLTTRAYDGMTTLYVAWLGHEYDGAGAIYGTPMGTTFGAGLREAFLAGQHLQERHIEEVVATNAFTVRATPSVQSDGEVVTQGSDTTEGDGTSDSGGGTLDPWWMIGVLLTAAIRRRRAGAGSPL